MWARGYFSAAVGALDEAMIEVYIENQPRDEDGESVKVMVPASL